MSRNKNRSEFFEKKFWKKGIAGTIAVLLFGGSIGYQGNEFLSAPEIAVTAWAEETAETELLGGEEDGLLIEDSGEVEIDKTGADLEELKRAERQEAEAIAESEAAARELAEELAKAQLKLAPADTAILQQHLDKLTEIESPTGSDGELICGEYIKEVMEQYGFTTSEQHFHEGFINENGVDAPGMNIIAERGADTDPEDRTNEIFIVAAHYDSKTNPDPEDPFANDKTGAVVLLEMARILSSLETDTDICFVFFSGEEDGLYGSANFVDFMEDEYAHRVSGVLYVELAGYAPEYKYLLKTADGQENSVGNRIKETALAELLVQSMENNEQDEILIEEDWFWTADEETSQYSFAQAGMTAVTVSQDVYGDLIEEGWLWAVDEEYESQGEETEILTETDTAGDTSDEKERKQEIAVDMDKLAKITDILAACVWEVME